MFRRFVSADLERVSVVLSKRLAVEFVHHLNYADHHLLSVKYWNAQQTLYNESILVGNLRQTATGLTRYSAPA